MANLKDLRIRITSVKSTQKITSAMKMVAASKLRRAQASAEEARPYADLMEHMLGTLTASLPTLEGVPPLLAGTGSEDVHLIVAVTADRGLCGGFNNNIVREVRRRVEALHSDAKSVKLLCVGRKGRDALNRDYASIIVDTLENVTRTGADFEAAPPAELADIERQPVVTSGPRLVGEKREFPRAFDRSRQVNIKLSRPRLVPCGL